MKKLIFKKYCPERVLLFNRRTVTSARCLLVFAISLFFQTLAFAQVGISNTTIVPDASSILELRSSSSGFLSPRMTTVQRDVIVLPAKGLSIFNIDTNQFNYYDGTVWKILGSDSDSGISWSKLGNAGTVYSTNFLGTTDNVGLSLRTNNVEALHIDSLQNVSIGIENTTNKFEVAGAFRLHQDSFNILHTTDLFGPGGAIPDIHFAGTKFRAAGADDIYINGIVDLPVGVSDPTVQSIFGNINTSNPGMQSLISVSPGNMSISSQANNASSSINLDDAAHLNLSIGSNGDSSSNISLNTSTINLNHRVNNIGYTSMNFSDSSFDVNVNETVDNTRNSNVQIRPNDYNVYNSDNGNGSSWNFNAARSNLSVNSSVGSSHLNITDSSYGQYISESVTRRYSSNIINPDDYNLYNNDSANGNYSGAKFNSRSYNLYINSALNGSIFSMNDTSASFTSNVQLKFGIGTGDPTNALHVNASSDPVRFENLQSGSSSDDVVTVDANGVLHTSAAVTAAWGLNGNSGTTVGTNFLGTTDAKDFAIYTNNNERLRVQSGGNVGIGTASPQRLFHVLQNDPGTPSMFALENPNTTDGNGMSLSFRGNTSGAGAVSFKEFNSIQSVFNIHDNATRASSLVFFTSAGGFAAERMRIGSTGNFGIGTTTPSSSLETAGSFGTSIITTATNITLDKTHYTVIVTGGTPAITLPVAGPGNNRRSYRIINQHLLLPVTISPYIDFTGLSASIVPPQSKIEIQSNGISWYRVD